MKLNELKIELLKQKKKKLFLKYFSNSTEKRLNSILYHSYIVSKPTFIKDLLNKKYIMIDKINKKFKSSFKVHSSNIVGLTKNLFVNSKEKIFLLNKKFKRMIKCKFFHIRNKNKFLLIKKNKFIKFLNNYKKVFLISMLFSNLNFKKYFLPKNIISQVYIFKKNNFKLFIQFYYKFQNFFLKFIQKNQKLSFIFLNFSLNIK